MRTIHESFTFALKNADYQKIVVECDKSIRVIIHSDPNQSYAFVEVWDNGSNKWNKAHSVLPLEHDELWKSCRENSCFIKLANLANDLIKLAIEIANIK